MATFMSNPLSSFNPGGGPPGASKNYVLPGPSSFSVHVFKAPALSPSSPLCSNPGQQLSVSARGDMDYKPLSYRDPRLGASVHEAPRMLVKPLPSSHGHQEDRERDRDQHRDTRRFGFIHSGPVPDTYANERSIALSELDPYRDRFYPPSSDSSVSEIDSIFSLTSSASSSNSNVDDDCPPRALHVARPTTERRPSLHHGGGKQRSGMSFSVGYHHAYPTCPEMSNNPPRTASRAESAAYAHPRPIPTPPVSARVCKDNLVLASERSIPPLATRPWLPQLCIGDRPAYPTDAVQGGAWADPAGYLSTSEPPPREYGQTIDITCESPHRQPNRRNSDGDQGHILPPRPHRSNIVPPPRSVRWCEDLICPNPIPPSQRRKGWFNRRGYQLWRNDGSYKPPAPGEDYPEDLDEYPEPSEGWQNEDGVRIDLNRRLIPQAPPRSVLKRTNYCKEDSIIAGYLTNGPVSLMSDDD